MEGYADANRPLTTVEALRNYRRMVCNAPRMKKRGDRSMEHLLGDANRDE